MNELTPPLSKSDAQRALVLADVLGVTGIIAPDEVLPRDVEVLRRGLVALRQTDAHVDCHDGGAPFRFLLTQAALRPEGHTARFLGSLRLGARPHGPLLQSLRAALHCTIEPGPEFWPLVVRTGPDAFSVRRFEVTGLESSQFASSLLLGAARVAHRTNRRCEVGVEGALTSVGYLELTQQWVERTGFKTRREGHRWSVEPPTGAVPFPPVPGDWSSLTYLLLLGWKSGAVVSRVSFESGHPDERFASHLRSVGLQLRSLGGQRVIVEGVPTGGLTVDAEQCPDAVPALVALACILPELSRFTRIGVLRHKESDRVEGVCDLARRIGATAEVDGETLRVTPAKTVARELEFDARDDHRLAMSSAVLSALTGSALSLRGADSVAKSFPLFWNEARRVGLTVRHLE